MTSIGAHTVNLSAPGVTDLRSTRTPYPRTTHACFGEYVAVDVVAVLSEWDVAARGEAARLSPGDAAGLRRRCDKCVHMRLTVGCDLVSGGHALDCSASSLTCKMIASTLPGAVLRGDQAVTPASWRFSCFFGWLDG
jgi:hypothetical protein